jgi:hypothetical protein
MKRLDFSKALAIWAAAIATIAAIVSFALAAFDKQSVSDLAITIFTACIGYMVTYAGKSAYEKNSRNKHGLDTDGNPLGRVGPGMYAEPSSLEPAPDSGGEAGTEHDGI